ncbi:MarR family transcriptional regulator [Gordonia sp. NB41Y]|uniref:MarR family winged helix-turn-helix transcriptional regulator n=1 Tax=Gordonia sp. NB41Y TaxID=875808 RepID=UPI0006B170AD|nr:MarR family transcriptional regulator [Gordonia sp. NB41Y]KOY49853.1 MarR family transcriptional regulator [Gordonia sp. NB41Y]WLP88695.1 MarR family transcriptional regulator [Gordonia sp. NB41Y]
MAAKKKAEGQLPDITDPVEWAAHYWEQQDLVGDPRRFQAMTSLLRFERIVADRVEVELKQHGLNLTDYLMLMTLMLSESGTRLISSLARNLLVHATTATLATDRLEDRGLLYRSPHPTDRRATCVTITDEGRTLATTATEALSEKGFGMESSTPQMVEILLASLTAMRDTVGDTQTKSS